MICCRREQSLNNNEYKGSNSHKLPIRLQLAFGVGHVLNDVCSSIWFSYLLLFMQYVLKFSSKQAGFIILIGQVADALANPFVGYLSDKPDSLWICKYGRRKIWHLIGTAGVVIGFPFIFQPCPYCEGSRPESLLFYYCVFTVIFQFGWAAVQISHLSLIPEITPDENKRTKLAAIRYCFTVLSNIFVYVVAWPILGVAADIGENHLTPADAPKFQKIAWAAVVVGILCSVIFHCFVKEKSESEREIEEATENGSSISEIFSDIEYYKVAVIYMSTMLYINLTQIYVPLYIHKTLEMPSSALAIIPLILYLGSFATSLVVEKLNRFLGRQKAYATGAVIGVIGCTWMQLRSGCAEFIYWEIIVVAVMFGVASAIILVTNLGITADLIGNKTGSGAFIYSIMTVTDKLANGITVYIIQHLQDTYAVKTFHQNILVFVCGGAIILATCSVITLKRRQGKQEEYIAIP